MNAKSVTKFTVNNMIQFGTAVTVSAVVRPAMPRFQNPVVNALAQASAFTTAYFVAGTIADKHVVPYADVEIDKLFALIEHHTAK
jgi:predicted lipoprotein